MGNKRKAFLVISSLFAGGILFGQQTTSYAATTAEKTVTIETPAGEVRGLQAEKSEKWFGIPYGEAQRFQSPTATPKWKGVKDATEAAPVAIQLKEGKVVGKENQLNLDIYKSRTTKKQLPVLVYIHGGNNQSGKAGEISGQSFVENHEAIVISLDYRLGAFGFNPLAAVKTGSKEQKSGNYSLLDIHQALNWIHKNIKAFDGDPDNVTVAGFSAGGRDVMAMLISPLFKNDFQKAVVFSGGMTTTDEPSAQNIFATKLAPLVVADGVKPTEAAAKKWLLSKKTAVQQYLTKLSAARLTQALSGDAGIRMSGFPHLYRDGYVLPKAGFQTKEYNKIPVLVTSGAQEFSLFALSDPYFYQAFSSNTLEQDPERYQEYQFVNQYGGKLYQYFNLKQSIGAIETKAPIYALQFDFGSKATSYDTTSKMPLLQSFHGVFVPFLDTNNQNYQAFVGKTYQTAGAQELATIFQQYLYQYLQTGKPGKNSYTNVTWDAVTQKQQPEVLSLSANQTQATTVMRQATETPAEILNEMKKDPTLKPSIKDKLVKNVLNGRWFSQPLSKW